MSNVKLLEVKPEEFDENFAYRFKALMSNVKQQPVEDNNVVAEEFQSSNE